MLFSLSKVLPRLLTVFVLKYPKISLAAALCGLLAFAPAEVLAKDIQLEVVILDG